jgi:hypothetical protein
MTERKKASKVPFVYVVHGLTNETDDEDEEEDVEDEEYIYDEDYPGELTSPVP